MNNNRLRLNFQLDTVEERRDFLSQYVQKEEFIKKPFTEEELEMLGNYLLWGKDNDGKNSVQKKLVEIKTRNGTWDKKENESLDALIENPNFNEAQMYNINSIGAKIPREVFSRSKALKEAPATLIPIFKNLFRQIDELDLMLNYYDLAHGKRKNPPREELLQRFTKEEQKSLQEQSTHLNQFKYLKMRHLLVELRREQFILKDSYSSTIQRHTPYIAEEPVDPISFDSEIKILPLGLNSGDKNKISQLIFREEYIPEDYTEEELNIISDYLWEKKKQENSKLVIDFRELEHIYNLFLLYFELEDETFKHQIESETDSLLETLKYYISIADLSETQQEILKLKMRKVKNQEIANIINKKYNKSYTANYISTIFRQKIIKQINDAARYHEEVIGNLFFPENFKKCTHCGKMFLIDSKNFVKKSRAKDGFSNRCKKCDKKDRTERKRRKENNEEKSG